MTSKWKANGWGASPDAMKIAEARTYPKPSGRNIPNGVPRGGVNAQSYQIGGNSYLFESEGVDSEERTEGFADSQLLGFGPGTGRTKNTPF